MTVELTEEVDVSVLELEVVDIVCDVVVVKVRLLDVLEVEVAEMLVLVSEVLE